MEPKSEIVHTPQRKWWVGTSGWFYKHWQGVFYPDGMKNREWLGFYVEHFPAVEVNATFYRLPFKGIITNWLRSTPSDFKFVIKGSRRITHYQKLKEIETPLSSLLERLSPLREKILCILWQLPPSLRRDDVLLNEFLLKLPNNFRYAIEFRHASWIDDATFKILKSHNVAHTTISAPNLPCNLTTTTDFAYIRFHGISGWYNYNYSEEDLMWWRNQIQELDKNVKRVLAFFNNDANGYAAMNAMRLIELLEH